MLARLLWVEVEGPVTEHLSSASERKLVLFGAPRGGEGLGMGQVLLLQGLKQKFNTHVN